MSRYGIPKLRTNQCANTVNTGNTVLELSCANKHCTAFFVYLFHKVLVIKDIRMIHLIIHVTYQNVLLVLLPNTVILHVKFVIIFHTPRIKITLHRCGSSWVCQSTHIVVLQYFFSQYHEHLITQLSCQNNSKCYASWRFASDRN